MDKKMTQTMIAIFSGILGLLFLLGLFAAFDNAALGFADQSYWIAGTLFFLGICCYTIMKLMGKDAAKTILLITGLLGTIFSLIYLFNWIGDVFDDPRGFTYVCAGLADLLLPLVVFGLIPLVKGLHKVIGKAE